MSLLILAEQDDLREAIKGYIESLELFNYIHVTNTIEEGLALSEAYLIDMFIVDMQLSDGSGDEFLKKVRQLEGYSLTWCLLLGREVDDCDAMKASYESNVCNRLLLKPIDAETIGDHVMALSTKKVISTAEDGRLRIKRKSKDYFFNHDDIVFVETVEKMAYIHTVDQKHKVGRITLNDLEKRLDNKKFMRVHRSYIINTDYIDYIKKQNNQNQIKVKYYEDMIPVGRTYRSILGLV